MGTTFRFLEDPAAPSSVLTWFRNLEVPPREVKSEKGFTLHFQEAGPVSYHAGGQVDPKASPIAMVVLPRVRRGALWTVGEVHFVAAPLRERFPAVHKISAALSKWLATHECVYSNKRKINPFSYHLEGSVQNYDPEVFAFDSALSALNAGQYFVTEDDTEFRLDALCKMLRLRGVECRDL